MENKLKSSNEPVEFKLVAKTMAGLEEFLAKELEDLGAKKVSILKRAVEFYGDTYLMYKANYLCRTALRILKPLKTFKVKNEKDLYVGVGSINWRKFMTLEGTFAVDSNIFNSAFNNSMFVSLKTKDAIVDQFRRIYNSRPSIDTRHPDLRVNIHIANDLCTLSIDSSGESLHHRGYRDFADKAPLNEVLAAGLIKMSGYDGNCHFVDPMCGSATLPIEAAMVAMNMPAGYYRKEFGFEFWADHDSILWDKVRNEADENIVECEYDIIGGDRSKKAIGIARDNVRNAKLHKDIAILNTPMEDINPPEGPGIVVTNPPYGERLEEEDIIGLYKALGDSFKTNFDNYSAFVISSNFKALKNLGLKSTRRIPIYNGQLECKVFQFDIYTGSKKTENIEGQEDIEGQENIEEKEN